MTSRGQRTSPTAGIGSAFRRSAGIPADRADDPYDQLTWWTTTLASLVDGPTSG